MRAVDVEERAQAARRAATDAGRRRGARTRAARRRDRAERSPARAARERERESKEQPARTSTVANTDRRRRCGPASAEDSEHHTPPNAAHARRARRRCTMIAGALARVALASVVAPALAERLRAAPQARPASVASTKRSACGSGSAVATRRALAPQAFAAADASFASRRKRRPPATRWAPSCMPIARSPRTTRRSRSRDSRAPRRTRRPRAKRSRAHRAGAELRGAAQGDRSRGRRSREEAARRPRSAASACERSRRSGARARARRRGPGSRHAGAPLVQRGATRLTAGARARRRRSRRDRRSRSRSTARRPPSRSIRRRVHARRA